MFDRDNKGQMTQSIGENGSGNQAEHDIYNITNYYGLSNEKFIEIFNRIFGEIKQDTVNGDLSYKDIVGIFNNLFEQNFYRISNEAKEIADSRCKELIIKFFTILYFQNLSGFNQAVDPDFQYDLFIAQRDYARCGDSILSNMLVRLLIERTKETERSLSQIVLNESIAVVSKLTKEELDTLTALFVIEYHSKACKFDNIPSFVNYISTYILPFWDSIKNEDSLFAHLPYTGCGVHMWVGTTGLDRFLNSRYKGPVEDRTNVRTNVRTYNIKYYIEEADSRIEPFFAHFDMSILNHMFLTSVGIAIGYANLCNVTGEEFNLSKWI